MWLHIKFHIESFQAGILIRGHIVPEKFDKHFKLHSLFRRACIIGAGRQADLGNHS